MTKKIIYSTFKKQTEFDVYHFIEFTLSFSLFLEFVLLLLTGKMSTKVSETILTYAEHSTIQGVGHIFASKSPLGQKIYWITTVTLMLTLAMYLSVEMFVNWNENEVVTNIKSASDVKVEFPSVTFCSQGIILVLLNLFYLFQSNCMI